MDALLQAAEDLRWLLGRGYPRDPALTLVGNRYALEAKWREVLKRGVLPPEVASRRRSKLLPPEALEGEEVALDGHNVLITLRSALRGETVLLADDGLVRDTAGLSAAFRPDEVAEKALHLVLETLSQLRPREIIFLLDAPMSRSGELAAKIRRNLEKWGLRGDAKAVPVPERLLEGFRGVVCSGDGAVVDRAEKVFDLAGFIVQERLKCPLLRLKG